MGYLLKVVFVDNSELVLEDTQKHFVSDDLEVLEITTTHEVLIVPMRQIKYVSCDATIFKEAVRG
ncbi:hypothetical protein NITGR_850005 [Nitrospina gracilis 3/211]|uniref:Uncharacterized protein n=1 Tax=Nitrospina gracilis (strain 3/211) TaxID=1266370 RepID=M1ZE51_NITG3|nr:hypothetical protein [Nitrospina sp. Nb-3]MCF8724637.1 hypothetical protein [Nitrospina sp. Nb-3]CCQ91818.1 hypothetical protein NITGR_850005 [Nitrospina gracilis 3/211]